MKNRWLTDDRETRQRIYSFIQGDYMNKERMDYCIDHAIKHLVNCYSNFAKCVQVKEENESPEDMGIEVARYYRELKYRKVGSAMGTAVQPAFDWVVVYFSKDSEKWDGLIKEIANGAYAISKIIQAKINKSGQREAEMYWNMWMKDSQKAL